MDAAFRKGYLYAYAIAAIRYPEIFEDADVLESLDKLLKFGNIKQMCETVASLERLIEERYPDNSSFNFFINRFPGRHLVSNRFHGGSTSSSPEYAEWLKWFSDLLGKVKISEQLRSIKRLDGILDACVSSIGEIVEIACGARTDKCITKFLANSLLNIDIDGNFPVYERRYVSNVPVIIALTSQITVNPVSDDEHQVLPRVLGPFAITFVPPDLVYVVISDEKRAEWSRQFSEKPHPHISDRGAPCFGDELGESLYSFLYEDIDFVAATELVMTLLRHANLDDDWGSQIVFWPDINGDTDSVCPYCSRAVCICDDFCAHCGRLPYDCTCEPCSMCGLPDYECECEMCPGCMRYNVDCDCRPVRDNDDRQCSCAQ